MKIRDTLFKYLNYILMIGTYMFMGAAGARACLALHGVKLILGFGIMFLSIIGALFFHIVIHEGGHLVAGLATGYEFVSFRIGSIAWIKDKNGNLQIKRMKMQGTGGQCLLSPPKVELEECPYKLYHLAGGLVNIVIGIIGLLLYIFVVPKNIWGYGLCLVPGAMGVSLGLVNLIPAKMGGTSNDGCNLWDMGRDLEAKECINLVLEMNARFTVAESFDKLSQELVDTIKSYDFTKMDLTNTAVANAFNYQIAIYYIEGNYAKVNELEKLMIETDGVIELFKNEARCECLFYEIITEQNEEKIEKLYNKNLKKYIKATAIYPSRLRLMYAYYHLYQKDEKEAEKYYEKLQKSVDTYMIKAEALLELEVATKLREK